VSSASSASIPATGENTCQLEAATPGRYMRVNRTGNVNDPTLIEEVSLDIA
jgi:hypothetical protein